MFPHCDKRTSKYNIKYTPLHGKPCTGINLSNASHPAMDLLVGDSSDKIEHRDEIWQTDNPTKSTNDGQALHRCSAVQML